MQLNPTITAETCCLVFDKLLQQTETDSSAHLYTLDLDPAQSPSFPIFIRNRDKTLLHIMGEAVPSILGMLKTRVGVTHPAKTTPPTPSEGSQSTAGPSPCFTSSSGPCEIKMLAASDKEKSVIRRPKPLGTVNFCFTCYIILDPATGVFLKCSSFGSISIHSLPTCEISSVLPPASLIVD